MCLHMTFIRKRTSYCPWNSYSSIVAETFEQKQRYVNNNYMLSLTNDY